MRRRGLKGIAAAGLLLLSSARPVVADDLSPIGNNVGGYLAPYSPEIVFVDVFRSVGEWRFSTNWDQGNPGPMDLDADGWVRSLQPNQRAQTGTFGQPSMVGRYPSGQYVCLYDGEGTLSFAGSVSVASQAPGRVVLNVDSSVAGGIGVTLSQTNPGNYLRNIRILMPGHEATYRPQPFYPNFLAAIQPYSAIRFLLWMHTPGAWMEDSISWPERVTGSYYTQASNRGVSLEAMIQLANAAHQHPYFTLPQGATDDYVRGFARMVRDDLDPTLKAHIEFSNEVWNSAFPTHFEAAAEGCAEGLNLVGISPGTNCTGGTMYWSAIKWQARRSGRVFQIFDEEFGPAGRGRYVKVLGGHIVPNVAQALLDSFHDPVINPIGAPADALAVAPYFGGTLGLPAQSPNTPNMTVDQLLDALQADVVTQGGYMTQNAALARARGMKMIAYEGGLLDLIGDWGSQTSTVRALFQAAAVHPRMEAVMTDYFTRWRNAGGELFIHFKNVEGFEGGLCGIFTNLNVDPATFMDASRYAAIVNFAAANPAWWSWAAGPADGLAPARPRRFRTP